VSKWTPCFGYQVAIISSNTKIHKKYIKIVQSYACEWDPITFTKDRVVVLDNETMEVKSECERHIKTLMVKHSKI